MHCSPLGAWASSLLSRGRFGRGTEDQIAPHAAAPRPTRCRLAAGLAGLVLTAGLASAQVAPPGAGVLLEEDFSFLSPSYMPNHIAPSGWDVDLAGGRLAYSYHAWFKMIDTSGTQPVTLSKAFARQTSGTLVWEFRFQLSQKTDGVVFQLRNGAAPVLTVQTSGGQLTIRPEGGNPVTLLTSYNAGQDYGVRVEYNFAAQTAAALVDGMSCGSVPLTCAGIDRVAISTSGPGTGDLLLRTVRILKDYLVHERFVTTAVGKAPQDWSISAVSGSATVQRFDGAMLPDTFSMCLVDSGTAVNAKTILSKGIGLQQRKVAYECKFLLPQKVDYMTWEMRCGDWTVTKVRTAGGNIGFVNNLGHDVTLIPNYRTNFWYHLKAVIDPATHTADIWINGKLVREDAPNEGALSGIDKIVLHTPAYSAGTMWLDDVLVYPVDEPADPVPAPAVAGDMSPGYDVGVQNCSLWREGHHLGWDRITPFVERKPLLGWYDEGSPEVASWEIKWMVEHGIDFQMFCWFRPAAALGKPVKDPYEAYALHEGFFQSPHSSRMKFVIAWENNVASAKDLADFKDHVVPYWIEYYFKDPRYYKPGNKPVIGIYSFAGLLRDFQNPAGVSAALAELRNQCVAAGFDGATLITNYNGVSTTELKDRKNAGFDYIFAYNWSERSQFAAHQKARLLAQRDAGEIGVIPTLGMGRDDGPWGGYELGYLTPAAFGDLASWARTTFMPSRPDGDLGRSLVLLDNWNEFGEGHFLMPSELAGFEYLTAIRTAFGGTAAAPTDVWPTESQLERINTLFPKDRVAERAGINQVKDPGFEGSQVKCGRWNATTELVPVAHEGLQGLKVTKQHQYGSVGFAVPLRNQREYFLSAWVKSTAGSAPQTLTLNLEYFTGTAKTQIPIVSSSTLHASQWTKISGTCAIHVANEISKAQVFVTTSGTSGTSYYLDDVEVSLNGNLIGDDPGFEGTRTACTTWSGSAALSSESCRTGTQSLKFSGTASYGSVYWPIRPGKDRAYVYSAWVRSHPGEPSGRNVTLAIDYLVDDAVNRTYRIVKSEPINSSGFTQVTGTCTISGTGNVHSVRTYLYLNPPGGGTFYIDDIDVR